MTPNLFQGETNPWDIPHVFSAIYRGAPCRSIYRDRLGAHFVQGFATKGNYLKGLGRDSIKMATLTQTQEILFLLLCCFCRFEKHFNFFIKKTTRALGK